MASRTHTPDGWQVVRLGDVADFQQGGTPAKSKTEYWGGHIPFVTGADLRHHRIGRGDARSFLTDEGLNSGATAICRPGSLLLATRTRVGLVGLASETMGASQDITLLTANDLADQSYLYRVLTGHAAQLQQRSRGTTIQGVTRGDIDSLPILLPPLPEQRAIAAVLDSIDEAIEGTEAIIAAIERLLHALLYALLTRGVPGWHMEWQDVPGLGTIPDGWQVVRLGDVADFQQGGTPAKSKTEYWGGHIPFVTGADLRHHRIGRGDARSFLTDEGLNSGATAICRPGSLLLATRTRVGLVGLASETMGASQDITLLTANDLADQSYLYRVLTGHAAQLQQRSRGTTIQGVTRGDIDSLPILLPPLPEQRAIAAVLDGIEQALKVVQDEWEGLLLLKASTAEALLKGRVRVGVQLMNDSKDCNDFSQLALDANILSSSKDGETALAQERTTPLNTRFATPLVSNAVNELDRSLIKFPALDIVGGLDRPLIRFPALDILGGLDRSLIRFPALDILGGLDRSLIRFPALDILGGLDRSLRNPTIGLGETLARQLATPFAYRSREFFNARPPSALNLTLTAVRDTNNSEERSWSTADGQEFEGLVPQDEANIWLSVFDQLVTDRDLHRISRNLFANGHYSFAVLRAYNYLDKLVKVKSGLTSTTGADLMRKAFRPESPIITLNSLISESEKNEQRGYMDIFAGVMTAIRNPRAHEPELEDDPEVALRLLVMASQLIYILNSSTLSQT